MVGSFRGQKLIVRAKDPSELVENLLLSDIKDVAFVQLTDLDAGTEPLVGWGEGVPIDLVLDEPATTFASLYSYSALQHKHPVRVTVPVRPGFSKAVRLALALKFAVKLDIGQPDPLLIAELTSLLDLYLHRTTTEQPIEFFHCIFLSFFRDELASLWQIQEEDPELYCFVADDGEKLNPRRPAAAAEDIGPAAKGIAECGWCEFFDRCRGFFKLPDPDYDCVGIKSLFTTLRNEAKGIQADLIRYENSRSHGERV
jgi:hypothetical protein